LVRGHKRKDWLEVIAEEEGLVRGHRVRRGRIG
jgi:hypothetical protein